MGDIIDTILPHVKLQYLFLKSVCLKTPKHDLSSGVKILLFLHLDCSAQMSFSSSCIENRWAKFNMNDFKLGTTHLDAPYNSRGQDFQQIMTYNLVCFSHIQ